MIYAAPMAELSAILVGSIPTLLVLLLIHRRAPHVFPTIFGGNASQREWLQQRASSKEGLPWWNDRVAKVLLVGFCIGGLGSFASLIGNSPSVWFGIFPLLLSVCSLVFVTRHYRWLRNSPEFLARADQAAA